MKNSDKILLPSSDLVLIAFGEDESVQCIALALLDDLPLDLGQGSKIEIVCKWITPYGGSGLTHVVNPPIASRTDWLS